MNGRLCALSLSAILPVLASAQSPSAGPDVKCAFQQPGQPSYVVWLCNPEGTATSEEGSVLWIRTNAAGAEVMTSVWHGPSDNLVEKAAALIARHQRSHRGCARLVHVARSTGSHVGWNTAPQDAVETLRSLAPPASGVCYAQEPGSADFVVVWGDRDDDLPNAFTVAIPPTADQNALGPLAPGLPKHVRPSAGRTLAVGVYRVDPGMDNSILRLGLSVFTSAATGATRPTAPAPFLAALRFLGRLPTPERRPRTP